MNFENDFTVAKTYYRKDYKGEWPFIAKEITIRCMYKYCIAVDILGETYALNGTMQDRIKGMKTPFDANLVRKGASVTDIIATGLSLWGDKELLKM